VLAVLLFIAFWVILGFSLFFIAVRGGLGGARATLQTQSRGGRKAAGTIFVIAFVGFGIALPVTLLLGNRSKANGQVGGLKLTSAEKRGRILFADHCAICHTLAAASAIAKVGPNLDTLKPPESLVLHTIVNGCLPNPPSSSPSNCLGQGVMPSDLIEGRDAEDVAKFVARVAGKE
jgi:mono/diheme cytochrome c family protein